MIEINDEENLLKDQEQNYQSNNGYILGTPFIRAFMVILDFHQNRIGFANKIRQYGAEITGDGSPG